LRQFGLMVDEAASDPEASAQAQKQPPDIVFLDIRMPGMDGRETLKRLRQQGVTAKIVAITASVLGYNKEHFLELGFDACVLVVDAGQTHIALRRGHLAELARKARLEKYGAAHPFTERVCQCGTLKSKRSINGISKPPFLL